MKMTVCDLLKRANQKADGEEDHQVGVTEGGKPGEDSKERGDAKSADATEEGKEMGDVVDDVVEEEEAKQEEMTSGDREGEHADSGEEEKVDATEEGKDIVGEVDGDVGEHADADICDPDASGVRAEEEGGSDDTGGGNETATRQDGAVVMGSSPLQPEGSTSKTAGVEDDGSSRLKPAARVEAEGSPELKPEGPSVEVQKPHEAVGTAEGNTSTKGTRILRELRKVDSHPDSPTKKALKAHCAGPVAPVATPARAQSPKAVSGIARATSADGRSRSPRAGEKVQGAIDARPEKRCQGILPKPENLKERLGSGENLMRSPAEFREQIVEAELDTKKKWMEELVSDKDYTRAAAVRDDVESLKALVQQVQYCGMVISELVAKKDYTGVGAVQQKMKAIVTRVMAPYPEGSASEILTAIAELNKPGGSSGKKFQLEQKLIAARKEMEELVAKKDYTGAGEAQAKVEELEKCLSVLDSSGTPAAAHGKENDVKAYGEQSSPAESARVAMKAEAALLEEKLKAKKEMINQLVQEKDFVGAATVQKEVNILETLMEQSRGKNTIEDEQLQVRKDIRDVPATKVDSRVAMKDPTGETVGLQAGISEEKLNAKKESINQLVLKREFIAAAAALEELKKDETLSEDLLSKKSMVDELGDKLQAGILEEKLNAMKESINQLVLKRDFNGAATVQEEVLKIETIMEELRVKSKNKGEQLEVTAAMVLERQLSAKQEIVDAFVTKREYSAAAAAQEEVKKVETLSEDLLSKKSMVDELGDKGEYARAAAIQKEIKEMEEQIMRKFALDNNDLAARPKATGPATFHTTAATLAPSTSS